MSPENEHLNELESEAIYIIREVAAQFENPVLLFSGGKDSLILLHLARKAFFPGKIPFPVMHIDTGHNFPEVIEFRDKLAKELGFDLIVKEVQETINKGRVIEETGINASRNVLQTTTLLDAIKEFNFDAALGGGRRDEEKARAKERIFSHRDEFGHWNPKNQRPELWNILNGRKRKNEHFRVFPISNWTELDVWDYIKKENLKLPEVYFAKTRQCIQRNGLLLLNSPCLNLNENEQIKEIKVRCRTVGDATCTGVIESEAEDIQEIINELLITTKSERNARFDDKVSDSSMEDRKKEGYF
jgi:sulfate adenylyltransferase subunit 2